MYKLVRVRGLSMAPVLADGELVLLRRLDQSSADRLDIGDIACFRHPDLGLIIKRIVASDESRTRFQLASENTLGSDGAAIGEMPATALVGRAICRLTPLPRRIDTRSGQ